MPAIVVACVLACVVASVLVLESRRTPDWERSLADYIQTSVARPDTGALNVLSISNARHPDLFVPDPAYAVITDQSWPITYLPKPDRLKCVLLDRQFAADRSGEYQQELVLLGYHSDGLWNYGWLVHTLPGDLTISEKQEDLDRLGCDLKLN